jgi:hypothetical protein
MSSNCIEIRDFWRITFQIVPLVSAKFFRMAGDTMGDIELSDSIRKPAKTLTAALVRSAKQPGRYFDGHGLFPRIMPGGTRQRVQRIVIRESDAKSALDRLIWSAWPRPARRR